MRRITGASLCFRLPAMRVLAIGAGDYIVVGPGVPADAPRAMGFRGSIPGLLFRQRFAAVLADGDA